MFPFNDEEDRPVVVLRSFGTSSAAETQVRPSMLTLLWRVQHHLTEHGPCPLLPLSTLFPEAVASFYKIMLPATKMVQERIEVLNIESEVLTWF